MVDKQIEPKIGPWIGPELIGNNLSSGVGGGWCWVVLATPVPASTPAPSSGVGDGC